MSRIFFILLFVFTFSVHAFSQNDSVAYFSFTGNRHTRSIYLARFINADKLLTTDSVIIAEDLRRLRTLSSILKVTPILIQTDSGTLLNYQIKERWTLLPVGDFGVTNGNFWLGGGAMESNLLGRGLYVYGYLEYGTPWAYQIILRNPYIFGTNWGAEFISHYAVNAEYWKFARSEYFSEMQLSIAVRYEIAIEKDVYAGIKYLEENLENKTSSGFLVMDRRKGITPFFKSAAQKIDFRTFKLNGWKNDLYAEQLIPLDDKKSVFRVSNDFCFYKLKGNSNLAMRLNLGFSTEQDTGFMPLITDSYTYIRGCGYRSYKGNRTAALSLEYRYTVMENRWAGIQALLFSDIGNTRSVINNNTFGNEFLVYGGPGIRLIFTQAYNAVLCIDYGVNLRNPATGSFVFGWGQYF